MNSKYKIFALKWFWFLYWIMLISTNYVWKMSKAFKSNSMANVAQASTVAKNRFNRRTGENIIRHKSE